MEKRLRNRLEKSLETEVAVMTCMEIYREEYDGQVNNKYEFSQFFSDYYKSHEEHVKKILENEYVKSSVEGSNIKQEIEDSDRGEFSKTEEVAISRYVKAIYLKGLDENGAKTFMIESMGDFNRSINKVSDENVEDSLENEDVDELDEEDIVDLIDEAVEESSGLEKSKFDKTDVINYAVQKALDSKELSVDSLTNSAVEKHLEVTRKQDRYDLAVGKDVLKKEYKPVVKEFRNNMMEDFIRDFLDSVIEQRHIRNYKSPDGVIEGIRMKLKNHVRKVKNLATENAESMGKTVNENMAAKAGSMAPMMIALLGATSIAFIFGVPVGPGAMALGGAILGTA